MDPSLPLPRGSYEEVCALAGREPALPQGPELAEEFLPGYRKGLATHALGALRLTLPGSYLYGWGASWVLPFQRKNRPARASIPPCSTMRASSPRRKRPMGVTTVSGMSSGAA